jgi:hypothetical protein
MVPAILLPPFLAETSFALWLLFRGVDEARWNAIASVRAP